MHFRKRNKNQLCYVFPIMDYGSEVWSNQPKAGKKWIRQLLYKTELNVTTVGLVGLYQLMVTIWI